jgi:two-component system nitrate/nitrite response regulator NarL
MDQEQSPSSAAIKIFVAGNGLIYTKLLADSLIANADFLVTSYACNSLELIGQILSQDFDVIIISSILDEHPLRGCETLRRLRITHPRLRAIILLDSSKREPILEAFRSGARGVFARDQSVAALAKCVRKVHEGQIWADSLQLSYAMEALASTPVPRAIDAKGIDLLSKRELDVVSGLARGLTNREIAEQLGLSQHTVKNYLFRIFDKLGVSNRVELLFLTLHEPVQPV